MLARRTRRPRHTPEGGIVTSTAEQHGPHAWCELSLSTMLRDGSYNTAAYSAPPYNDDGIGLHAKPNGRLFLIAAYDSKFGRRETSKGECR